MAIYKRDIVDINLENGNIHRSFLKHSIGMMDDDADHFGVRVFRNGEPVNLAGISVQGVFMPPQGSPIAITTGGMISENRAEIVLPQACYNYDGQFTLAIKLIGGGVTGTVRIVDGVVENTHASGTVAPTAAVPTYQEVLAAYEEAIDAIEIIDGLERNLSSIDQSVANLSNVIKYNLVDSFEVIGESYYDNESGILTIKQASGGNTNIIQKPIRLKANKPYHRGYLHNAFTFVCERDTKNIIRSISGASDPYIPDQDVDLYITIGTENLSNAFLYEVFTTAEFNTDKTLLIGNMPADAEITGKRFDWLKLVGEQVIPEQADNTETDIDNVLIDLKRKYICVLENLSNTAGYVRVASIYNGAEFTVHGTKLLDALGTNNLTLYRFIAGGAAYSDTTLRVKNLNGISFRITIFEYTDSDYGHPIHGMNRMLIVNGDDNRGNAEFENVPDAVRYAMNMYGKDDIIDIYIKKGVYNVSANQAYEPYCAINITQPYGTNNPVINLHGEDKETTIIQMTSDSNTSGRIIDMGAAGQIVENLTIKNIRGSNPDTSKRPYAIHNDGGPDPETEYTTTIKNCVLYSECMSPIGAGLRHNQRQIYEGCTFILAANADDVGTLYIHGPSRTGDVPIGLTVEGCTVICLNEDGKAVDMENVPDMVPYSEIPVTFRRTIAVSAGSRVVPTDFKQTHMLTIDSALNNNEYLNY